jgi:archaellum component FlaC
VLESLTNGRNPYTIKARRILSTAVQDVNGDVNGIKTLVYQAIEELKNAIPWDIE